MKIVTLVIIIVFASCRAHRVDGIHVEVGALLGGELDATLAMAAREACQASGHALLVGPALPSSDQVKAAAQRFGCVIESIVTTGGNLIVAARPSRVVRSAEKGDAIQSLPPKRERAPPSPRKTLGRLRVEAAWPVDATTPRLRAVRGPLVIAVAGYFCEPCFAATELEALRVLRERLETTATLAMVVVGYAETTREVLRLVDRQYPSWRATTWSKYVAPNAEMLVDGFDIDVFPTILVIDEKRHVRHMISGTLDTAGIDTIVSTVKELP